MKTIITLFSLFLFTAINAQVETPQASPFCKTEQVVGLTKVTIEYSRPGMKGRTIFGDLVPYGKVWRTGANENTKITFSDDVMIEDQLLKAGTYAIYTKPEKEEWTVYFYSDAKNWGNPQKWDDSKVAAKATAKVYEIPEQIETFGISVENVKSDSAHLAFIWSNVYADVEIKFLTDKKVMRSIEQTMSKEPKMQDYYSAASYYYTSNKDIKQAKEWIDQAMEMNDSPMFYQIRQQALIYAKSGDMKGAIALAEKSLEGAKKAGNNDYIKMNKASLKEWGAK